MSRQIQVGETTDSQRRVYFHLVDATDGITAELGEAGGQPQISIDGAAWTDTGIGVLSAIGNGRYYAELTESVVSVIGRIIETRYKSAATAECPGDSVEVIAEPVTTDSIITALIANIPALSRSRITQTSAMATAYYKRGFTHDVTLLNSAGATVAPVTNDVLRAVIGRDSEIEDDLSGAKLVVSSAAATANGSTFTKNSPSSGTNRLRLDASDLTFPPGTYTLFIDYYDSADANEWKTVEKIIFTLLPTT